MAVSVEESARSGIPDNLDSEAINDGFELSVCPANPSSSQLTAGRETDGQPGRTLETFKDQQSVILPMKKLLIVFPALALVQFTSFLDQTAVSTALPAIANALQLGTSISWVGASFLTASTSIQLIAGRLSDIFGRKNCLIVSISLLGLGNLIAGFANTPAQLYTGRSISGLGGGAINSLVQISISDITTLQQRGNFFGFIGVAVAFGNGLGPVIGGTLTEESSWRWALWFITPMAAVALLIIVIVLPATKVTGNTWQKTKLVDWTGLLTNIAAVVLVLVSLSEGGATLPWVSAPVISMLIIGAVLCVVFLAVEWRFAKLPIMPRRLFQNGFTANALLLQSFFIGWVFWGNLFYLPLYFQNVRGWTPSRSGVLILPMTIAHGVFSGVSGNLVSRLDHFKWIIIVGTAVWTAGLGCQIAYGQLTPVWVFVVVGIAEGFGVGLCLQPVLVAILANSLKADRAVMTGIRNFLRTIGGALGLIVSGLILNNILASHLQRTFPSADMSYISSSAFSLSSLNLSDEQRSAILQAYMRGLHTVFISYVPLIGFCFVTGMFIHDNGLAG